MVAYNIVFVGGTGVGKSSFINGLFYLEVSPTSNDFLEATEERKRCIAIQGFGEVLAILSPRQVFALPISHASKLTNVFIDWHNVNLHSESHFELFEFSKKTSVSILASPRAVDVAGQWHVHRIGSS